MNINRSELLQAVSSYYAERLAHYGDSPQGVDWNGAASQTLRFEQLTKVISTTDNFTLNDLGCGYGALLEFLNNRFTNFSYVGYDVSVEMISAARNRFSEGESVKFVAAAEPKGISDYGIASGIFNVRLEFEDGEWEKYILQTLEALNQTSAKGFAFNCLTKYSDQEKKRDYLFYADPCYLFDFCKQNFSKQVALYHDYGLYEFTIIVRK